MKFYCCFYVVAVLVSSCKSLKDAPSDADPLDFPFHALVRGKTTCNGILISQDYVLTPASCVHGVPISTVFIGFRSHPFQVPVEQVGSKSQIRSSYESIIHDDYKKVSDDRYLNNIALIKLSKSVKLSETIKPWKLMTKAEGRWLVGKAANISGWIPQASNMKKFAQVKIRSQATCAEFFEHQFFENQENCVEWFNAPLHLAGNAVTRNGKVVGYQTNAPPCSGYNFECNPNDLIFNVAPFLEWISEKMHISIADLTEDSQINVQQAPSAIKVPPKPSDLSEINKKFETLNDVIKEVKEQQQTDIEDLKRKLDELINNLQNKPKQDVNNDGKLNEQLKEQLRKEMKDNELKQNVNVLNLQKEIQESRNEFANNLASQKTQYENLVKLIEGLSKRNPQDDNRLANIENGLKNLQNENENNKVNIQAISDELLQAVYSQTDLPDLRRKLNELINPTKQDINNNRKLDEQANQLRQEITNSERNQNKNVLNLQKEIRDSRSEFANNLALQQTQYENLLKQIIEKSGKSNPQDDSRLANIENNMKNVHSEQELNRFTIQQVNNELLQAINILNDKLNLLQQDNLGKLQINPQNFENKMVDFFNNFTLAVNGRLNRFDNEIKTLKRTLDQPRPNEDDILLDVDQLLKQSSLKNEETLRKMISRVDLIEQKWKINQETFNIKLKENQETITIVLRSLRNLELQVQNCCFDGNAPPPA